MATCQHQDDKMEQIQILTQCLGPFQNSKCFFQKSFSWGFKNGIKLNFHAEMREKLGVELDVKIMTNVLFGRSFHYGRRNKYFTTGWH